MNKPKTDYLQIDLKNRILILNFNIYLNSIMPDIVDYLNEWGLIKESQIKGTEKTLKYFIEKKVLEEIKTFKEKYKTLHFKGLIVLNFLENNMPWESYFLNKEKIVKSIKRLFLKNYKNSFESFNTFNKTEGFYKSYNCLNLSGEEKEFLIKALDKYKVENN